MIKYLSKESYLKKVDMAKELYDGRNWNSSRWHYHNAAVQLVKEIKIQKASDVLELGCLGVQLVEGSNTMDYTEHWNLRGWKPTITHDAREIPWPIMKAEYKLFISLRVWQHLGDMQEAAFKEAKRISGNLVLVIPFEYKNGYGVSPEQIFKWNGGPPIKFIEKGRNGIYLI